MQPQCSRVRLANDANVSSRCHVSQQLKQWPPFSVELAGYQAANLHLLASVVFRPFKGPSAVGLRTQNHKLFITLNGEKKRYTRKRLADVNLHRETLVGESGDIVLPVKRR